MKLDRRSTHRNHSQRQAMAPWQRLISGVRPRLLVSYFLLTTCTTLVSIHATRQIFCENLQIRSREALDQQVKQFQLMVDKNRFKGATAAKTLPVLFNRLFSNYASLPNEYILMFIDGQLYRSSDTVPSDLLSPQIIQNWQVHDRSHRGRLALPSHQSITYAVEPVQLGNQTGLIVAIHNSSAEFQAIDQAIARVTQIAVGVLALCLLLTWGMTGRILAPLKLLTQTAQSISESDMTQRIPVRGHDEIAELSATFNDMLDRLQEAFDSQKEFLKDASHELRTPITVMQGHLEVLQYLPADKQAASLDLVLDELQRMARLVNDLLVLAKADHPDFLQLKPEELDWLTEEIYLKARSLAPRHWQLESKGLSPLTVDRQRLTQAIMNLVQNAVRHTQPDDRITLGSAVKEEYAYLWVRDTGNGIAESDQTRIFERFVRAAALPTHLNPALEGHGLGLSIVAAVVQAHGGWIELDSQVGHGSTFTLVLPLSPPDRPYESDPHRRRQSPHQRLSGNGPPGPWLSADSRGDGTRRHPPRE